jgi:hypothetical protein
MVHPYTGVLLNLLQCEQYGGHDAEGHQVRAVSEKAARKHAIAQAVRAHRQGGHGWYDASHDAALAVLKGHHNNVMGAYHAERRPPYAAPGGPVSRVLQSGYFNARHGRRLS